MRTSGDPTKNPLGFPALKRAGGPNGQKSKYYISHYLSIYQNKYYLISHPLPSLTISISPSSSVLATALLTDCNNSKAAAVG